jgi:hypothetical protein
MIEKEQTTIKSVFVENINGNCGMRVEQTLELSTRQSLLWGCHARE